MNTLPTLASAFIEFSIAQQVLKFGTFKTKAGRISPYFFNAGLFYDGATLGQLADFYAQVLATKIEGGQDFDVIYGPAYKGITLAAATAMKLAERGHNKLFTYNRKEVKDHGEGGLLVGAPLKDQRVVIIDDVISAGVSIDESVAILKRNEAKPVGVVIALDRMEKGGAQGEIAQRSAVEMVFEKHHVPVWSIANLSDLLTYLECCKDADLGAYRQTVMDYRNQYGIQ